MARFLPVINALFRENLTEVRRNLREEMNPFNLPEERFCELFRLDIESARELIRILEPYMAARIRRHRVSKANTILAALRFFATGSYQRCVGQDFMINLSQSQMSRAITETADVIVQALGHTITLEARNYQRTKESVMRQFGIPGVIGFVDGTHIAITNPGRGREHQYLNRKGFHSKNVQLICDLQYNILGINAQYGGASHDAFIFRNSQVNVLLNEDHRRGERTSWLLGDSGYPLLPYLLTPFRNAPENGPEARFNMAHQRARSCVERCIGVLKARFRCLNSERVLKYSPEKAGTIINACAILHNFMVGRGLPLPDEREIAANVNAPYNEIPIEDEQQGNQFAILNRRHIAENYFEN